ncbi:YEATS domain-containing protein 4 [Nephila pilipes]|uniref:YEATS domain-containing protein 4 n=1 Tax=Nephila pilipes TaxID=299642 RepID=A0A8X6QCE0_NEPPI|nr:YEATS domain-containing protein 4 [Nephila pilipes]
MWHIWLHIFSNEERRIENFEGIASVSSLSVLDHIVAEKKIGSTLHRKCEIVLQKMDSKHVASFSANQRSPSAKASGAISKGCGATCKGAATPSKGIGSFSKGIEIPNKGAVSPNKGTVSPNKGTVSPNKGTGSPCKGIAMSGKGTPMSGKGSPIPGRGPPISGKGASIPSKGSPLPSRGAPIPSKGASAPNRGAPIPSKGVTAPSKGVPLPNRGAGIFLRGPGTISKATGTISKATGATCKVNPSSDGGRLKGVQIVKPIIYGNVAWYLGTKRDQDGHTHQWNVYLKAYENEDLSVYIKRVHFKLHESYAEPNRVCYSPPYGVTETGWGEFEVAMKIFFQDSNERPVIIYHFLKLFDREKDGNVKVGSAPVQSEFYDEMIFTDPTTKMYRLLTHPRMSPHGSPTHRIDYEERKASDLQKILAAKKKVRQEIADLKSRLGNAKDSIHKLKSQGNVV